MTEFLMQMLGAGAAVGLVIALFSISKGGR
jgi:hypothetical protein